MHYQHLKVIIIKNFLRKMNINKSTSNNTTINTLTVINKKNNSGIKMNRGSHPNPILNMEKKNNNYMKYINF
jgi:hypothetical protein